MIYKIEFQDYAVVGVRGGFTLRRLRSEEIDVQSAARAFRVIKFLLCALIVALTAAMMSPSEGPAPGAIVADGMNPAAGPAEPNPPGSDATANGAIEIEKLIALHRNWCVCP